MSDGASYALQDFIPFSADVYFRLLERMGETYWPLQLLTLLLGLAALWLALKHRARLASLLVAPVWAFVAYAFFIQLYAELNWAGDYIAYAFFAQAVLLLVPALTGLGLDKPPASKPAAVIGLLLSFAGLIVLPFIAPLTGSSWYQAEIYGIHPDPTSITTLGLALLIFRSWTLWLMAVIPALWLLVSALTLLALGAAGAILLLMLWALAVIGLGWKSLRYSSLL